MTIETGGGQPPSSTIVTPSRLESAKAVFRKPMVLAGIGGACVLGLALGLLARPQLGADTRAPGSMKPVDQMQIEIDRDEPLPAVEGGKLELLPAGLKAPRPAPAPPARAQAPQDDLEAEPPVIPVRRVMPPPRPMARGPSFDCAESASAAEALVCSDEGLAAQDRSLAAAWRRALDSGVPAWRLRRQQQRWLDAREDAARNAPEMVSDLYEQRIGELQDLAAMNDR